MPFRDVIDPIKHFSVGVVERINRSSILVNFSYDSMLMKENTAEVKNLNALNQALTIKLTFSTIKKTPK